MYYLEVSGCNSNALRCTVTYSASGSCCRVPADTCERLLVFLRAFDHFLSHENPVVVHVAIILGLSIPIVVPLRFSARFVSFGRSSGTSCRCASVSERHACNTTYATCEEHSDAEDTGEQRLFLGLWCRKGLRNVTEAEDVGDCITLELFSHYVKSTVVSMLCSGSTRFSHSSKLCRWAFQSRGFRL